MVALAYEQAGTAPKRWQCSDEGKMEHAERGLLYRRLRASARQARVVQRALHPTPSVRSASAQRAASQASLRNHGVRPGCSEAWLVSKPLASLACLRGSNGWRVCHLVRSHRQGLAEGRENGLLLGMAGCRVSQRTRASAVEWQTPLRLSRDLRDGLWADSRRNDARSPLLESALRAPRPSRIGNAIRESAASGRTAAF